ncbi:Pentatricopeptide repeat-containing protein [Drosera capensis]
MSDPRTVQWTSKIKSFSRRGLSDNALCCFRHMQRAGVEPNELTLPTILTACTTSMDENFGMGLHCLAQKKGYSKQMFVSSGLIGAYSKCGNVYDARKLFDEMLKRDVVLWNSMISGFSQRGLGEEACSLFAHLKRDCRDWNVLVNDFTLATVVNACAKMGFLRSGQSLHCFTIKAGFDFNIFVGGSLVDMYCKCGRLTSARCLFDGMEYRDIVVWNTMLGGYAQNDEGEEALDLFCQMKRDGIPPDGSTFSLVVQASTMMSDSALGRCFHAKTLQLGFSSDLYVGTALVDMYSKCMAMDDAEKAFYGMSKISLVSYNAFIYGYGLHGAHEGALRAYKELMLKEMKPDSCTLFGFFSSCAASCAFLEGAQVHCHSILLGLDLNVSVGNSIVNFYSSCGDLDSAFRIFLLDS